MKKKIATSKASAKTSSCMPIQAVLALMQACPNRSEWHLMGAMSELDDVMWLNEPLTLDDAARRFQGKNPEEGMNYLSADGIHPVTGLRFDWTRSEVWLLIDETVKL